MVVSLIALFVALGGTAIAGGSLIGSKQIADHSIRLVDLNGSAVKALHGQRGADGSSGEPGANGAQGATGPVGPAGLSGLAGAPGTFNSANLQYLTGPDVSVAPGTVGSANAYCPSGTRAISGGFFSSVTTIGFSETFGPSFHGIAATNNTGITLTIRATVVCAS
jgi:hypothetical protein